MRTSMSEFISFIYEMGPELCGATIWKELGVDVGNREFGSAVTVFDEAFCQLVVENNWNKLFHESHPGLLTAEDKAKNPNNTVLYTKDGDAEVNNTQGSKGWSSAGHKRYRELVDLVKQDRIAHGQEEFDQRFAEECQRIQKEKADARKAKKRRKQQPILQPASPLQPVQNFSLVVDPNDPTAIEEL